MLGGKWKGMMAVPPGYTALYHKKPDVVYTDGAGEIYPGDLFKICNEKMELRDCHVVDLSRYSKAMDDVRIIKGIGYDWQVLQLGEPCKTSGNKKSEHLFAAEYTFPKVDRDSVDVIIYTVPFWPLHAGRGNAISVSVDGGEKQIFDNKFAEYSRGWKDQVMRNGAECRMRFAVDKDRFSHTLSFFAGDSGQMIQRVIIDWGGLKQSYIGPSVK